MVYGYKMGVFPFERIQKKILDLPHMMTLDIKDCFLKRKTSLIAEFHKTGLQIQGNLGRGFLCLIAE